MDRNAIEKLVREHVEQMLKGQANKKPPIKAPSDNRILLAADWRVDVSVSAVKSYVAALLESDIPENVRPVLFAPYLHISTLSSMLRYERISYGAVDVSAEDDRQCAGEVSAKTLSAFSCSYVMVGHPDRRRILAETADVIGQKTKNVLARGMKPVICLSHAGQIDAIYSNSADLLEGCMLAYIPDADVSDTEYSLRSVYDKMSSYGLDKVPLLCGVIKDAHQVQRLLATGYVKGLIIEKESSDAAGFISIAKALG